MRVSRQFLSYVFFTGLVCACVTTTVFLAFVVSELVVACEIDGALCAFPLLIIGMFSLFATMMYGWSGLMCGGIGVGIIAVLLFFVGEEWYAPMLILGMVLLVSLLALGLGAYTLFSNTQMLKITKGKLK